MCCGRRQCSGCGPSSRAVVRQPSALHLSVVSPVEYGSIDCFWGVESLAISSCPSDLANRFSRLSDRCSSASIGAIDP